VTFDGRSETHHRSPHYPSFSPSISASATKFLLVRFRHEGGDRESSLHTRILRPIRPGRHFLSNVRHGRSGKTIAVRSVHYPLDNNPRRFW